MGEAYEVLVLRQKKKYRMPASMDWLTKRLVHKQKNQMKKLSMRMYGSSLADVFRAPAYDCKALGPDQKPEFAVTRLRSGPREMEKAPVYPPDQAILIC